MALEFYVYDNGVTDWVDIANLLPNNLILDFSIDFVQQHLIGFNGMTLEIPKGSLQILPGFLAYYQESGTPPTVIWSGHTKNVMEKKNTWLFDIVPEIEYINGFNAARWAGTTPREKLERAMFNYIAEHDFEGETDGNPPSGWTTDGSYAFFIQSTQVKSGTKGIYSAFDVHVNEAKSYRSFTRRTSGLMYVDFKVYIPSAGDRSHFIEATFRDGLSNVMCGFSYDDEDNIEQKTNGSAWADVADSSMINLNQFNKVRMMLDIDNNEWSMWVNYELVVDGASVTISGVDRFYLHHERTLGADVEAYIDDVYIFNTAVGTAPWTAVNGDDANANTLLNTEIAGIDTLDYSTSKEVPAPGAPAVSGSYGDLLHDMLMIMAATHNASGEFLICTILDEELHFKTDFGTNVLVASETENHEWGNEDDKKLLEKITNTDDLNDNLRAGEGAITESISQNYLIYILKNKFRGKTRYSIGDGIEYPGGTDRGFVNRVSKNGLMYDYELTKLFYALS